jgi:predicted methyltransferase
MWYIIDGNEHISVNTLEEGVELMHLRAALNGRTIHIMSEDEYNTSPLKRTKRGKRSLNK